MTACPAQWSLPERRWLRQLLQAMLPPVGAWPGIVGTDLTPFWRAWETAAPSGLRAALRAAVWALQLSPPVLLGRLSPFSSLSPEDQDRLLTVAARSPHHALRQLVLTVKLVACLAYLADPAVQDRARALGAP